MQTTQRLDLIAQAGTMSRARELCIKLLTCKGRHTKRVGSGVRRVINTFVAYGLPEPEFEATQGGMAVTVFKNTDKAIAPAQPEPGGVNAGVNVGVSEKTPVKTPVIKTVKTPVKILAALSSDPTMTIPELAATIGLTTRPIERALKKLQQEARLLRVGHDNGGHWKVLDPK